MKSPDLTALQIGSTSSRLHYAWIILAVTFLVVVVTAGVRATPSVLIVPLEEEFYWSRATISFAVSVNLQPAAVPRGCGPLDSSPGVVTCEGCLAVLLVPFITGIDLYTTFAGSACGSQLRHEPRQVGHVGDRRVNRIRRRRDVFGVLMLHARSSRFGDAGSTLPREN